MEAVATLGSMQPQVLSANALPDGDLQVVLLPIIAFPVIVSMG